MFAQLNPASLSLWPAFGFAFRIFLGTVVLAPTQDPSPPNIIFFLIDDLGYAVCGLNGGKESKTPNIDSRA